MPKPKEQQAVEAWILEYRSGTSDKFYAVYVTDGGVTVLRAEIEALADELGKTTYYGARVHALLDHRKEGQ